MPPLVSWDEIISSFSSLPASKFQVYNVSLWAIWEGILHAFLHDWNNNMIWVQSTLIEVFLKWEATANQISRALRHIGRRTVNRCVRRLQCLTSWIRTNECIRTADYTKQIHNNSCKQLGSPQTTSLYIRHSIYTSVPSNINWPYSESVLMWLRHYPYGSNFKCIPDSTTVIDLIPQRV